ncbi:hypothetical protein BC830DRAFT_1103102 [Chytriomyces sp. MP71]|nr:hypothetical protein BC830DRAFT_1103102 [Chytriomyces sp. MP71]
MVAVVHRAPRARCPSCTGRALRIQPVCRRPEGRHAHAHSRYKHAVGSREALYFFDSLCVGLMFLLSMFYCILFLSSPSSDGIMPDYPIQKTLWLFSSLGLGGGALIATSFLYAGTYLHVVKLLRSGMRNGREEMILEKLVLRSCIIMSGSLYLCYFPQFIVSAAGLNAYSPAGVLAAEFVALDVIVTPVLSVMLLRHVREETLEYLESIRMRWRSK